MTKRKKSLSTPALPLEPSSAPAQMPKVSLSPERERPHVRRASLPWNRWKGALWPVLFWGWVIWVSWWIDGAPAHILSEQVASQKYSNIRFKEMRFEQKYVEETSLLVESPEAWFESDTGRLVLDQPMLRWQGGKDHRSFIAQAQHGEIQSTLTDSALPSEFRVLELFGQAQAKGQSTSVESEKMLFDCQTRLFTCPGQFTFHQAGLPMKGSGMFYDPLKDRIGALGAH